MKGGMWQENNSVSCHKYKMNVPFKSIKQQLHREAKEGIVWIEKETEQSISFIDDASFSKPVTMVDPDCIDEEWIQQHIWIQPGIRDVPVDNLVKTLNKINNSCPA